jgi:DNA-binding transcriptional regulator YiaG
MPVKGKEIRSVRVELNMTQVVFAKFLSKETGESVSSRDIARMESYGKKGSCSPLSPSPAVVEVIAKHSRNVEKDTKSFGVISLMPQEVKDLEEKLMLYTELGILTAEGETAVEKVEAVKAHIREMELELHGENTVEARDLEEQLLQYEEEEKKLCEDLNRVNARLQELGYTPVSISS